MCEFYSRMIDESDSGSTVMRETMSDELNRMVDERLVGLYVAVLVFIIKVSPEEE